MTTITALPTPPSRDDSANFRSRADAFLDALPDFATEANALATELNAASTAAVAAAAQAESVANVTKWLSGTSYTAGNCVWSPVNYLVYRYIGAPSPPSTIDPSGDASNWRQVSCMSSHASAAIGYGTGAGGTVTQATDKSTGVTLNKPTGQITMHAAALGANSQVSFALTNSLIAATDCLVINQQYGTGTNNAYQVWAVPTAGAAQINVRNISAGALSESVVLNFVLIKGVTS